MPLQLKAAKRFAILCRVSTRDQLRGLSLEVQEKLGREYVKMRGGTVAKVWSAQESGTSENRAVLDEVLSKAGVLYDHLVIQDTTRLSRNLRVLLAAMDTLAKANVALHDFNGVLPFDSPEGEFNLTLGAVIGKFTARQSAQKSLLSRERTLQGGGIAAGRPPWGRRWIKAAKRFEIIPEKRQLLLDAYKLIMLRRFSLNRAAAELGLAKTSLRKAITSSALTQIVQRLNGKTYKFACPALLGRFQHLSLERRLSQNFIVRPETKQEYLLQGLVRCSS